MSFPIFYENSKVPIWLSKISPIEIGAISLGIFVFSRGEIDERTRRHETIHYLQWKELWFLGFMILYPLLWLREVLRGSNGADAYRAIPFEIEAYAHEDDPSYLHDRRSFSWYEHV